MGSPNRGRLRRPSCDPIAYPHAENRAIEGRHGDTRGKGKYPMTNIQCPMSTVQCEAEPPATSLLFILRRTLNIGYWTFAFSFRPSVPSCLRAFFLHFTTASTCLNRSVSASWTSSKRADSTVVGSTPAWVMRDKAAASSMSWRELVASTARAAR